MTPNLALVEIAGPRWHGMRLWLPLFLLWIPLVLLLPLFVLVLAVVCLVSRVSLWRALAAFWAISCSLPGTDVRVCMQGSQVTVKIL